MTTLYLRRVGNALFPDGDESVSALMTVPFGKPLKAEIKQQRNARFHRLFWAVCKRIGDGIGQEAETVATVFKYATGHYDLIKTKRYGDVKIPKSISFTKLDDIAFRVFYDRCIQVAFEEWGIAPEALADLIDQKTERRA